MFFSAHRRDIVRYSSVDALADTMLLPRDFHRTAISAHRTDRLVSRRDDLSSLSVLSLCRHSKSSGDTARNNDRT